MTTQTEKPTGLALLRLPFPENQISKLPKGTKAQNECPNSEKVNCKVCGGWHHPKIIHLDYVGHAALTDRLLDCDPEWNWEFQAVGQDGYPVIDKDGGFWIRLTVCGVTRLGYGDAQGKTGGNAMKERIGDALRNAAMRFGAALDLWHKGELHMDETETPPVRQASQPKKIPQSPVAPPVYGNKPAINKTGIDYSIDLRAATTKEQLANAWDVIPKDEKTDYEALKDQLKIKFIMPLSSVDWEAMIRRAQDTQTLDAILKSMNPTEQDEWFDKIDMKRNDMARHDGRV